MRPYLRVKNVFEDRIDLSDVKEMDFPPEQFERYRLEPGDILLNEGQSPEWVGRPAMYRGELPGACFTNSLIRFRPYGGVDGRYALLLFRYHLHSRRFMQEARITTNIAHISARRFASVEFPLPPTAEQQRIVAAVEEHLSRLDAADASLSSGEQRLAALKSRLLESAFEGFQHRAIISEVAEVRGGIQKQPKRRPQKNPAPFLRVANVLRGRLDLGTVHEIELFDGELPKYRLQPGDLLVVEGNGSPDQIGRSALWRGEIDDCVHQNHLIRVRPGPELNPRFLDLYWNTPSTSRQLTALASSTSGLYTLSTAKVGRVEVPVPSLREQERVVERLEDELAATSRLRSDLGNARSHRSVLSHSILSAAFTGKLVPQDPSDEPASVLLERIRAERAASAPVRRRRAKVSS
jgi:type I restriction enzyme S subunit